MWCLVDGVRENAFWTHLAECRRPLWSMLMPTEPLRFEPAVGSRNLVQCHRPLSGQRPVCIAALTLVRIALHHDD
jgi:hypothetical protein